MALNRSLNYATVNQLTYERLRDAIVRGELKPNQHIDPTALAAQFAVSRMPIREALHRLSESGFVVLLPHRGAFVAPLSRDRLEEIYRIRIVLEGYAAREATPHITDGLLEELRGVIREAESARQGGDFAAVTDLNRRFHELGYQASNLPLLCKMIGDLRTHSDRYRWLHARLPGRSQQAQAEHKEILEAWAKHDAAAAEASVRRNLENTVSALILAFEATNGS